LLKSFPYVCVDCDLEKLSLIKAIKVESFQYASLRSLETCQSLPILPPFPTQLSALEKEKCITYWMLKNVIGMSLLLAPTENVHLNGNVIKLSCHIK